MADEEIKLVVGDLTYLGWKSQRVTRSIETLAGSFALEVTDRWGDEEAWPIAVEDPCRISIGGEVVLAGYVDKPRRAISKEERTISYTGRDRSAALADCSALLSAWTFTNVDVLDFVTKVAKPFGVDVSIQPGLVLPTVAKVVVTPGDTAFEAIKAAIGDKGVLVVSDGVGGIVLTRAASTRASPLVEGQNILSAEFEDDGESRYHRYIVSSQAAGTDEASGSATRTRAEAIDEGVRRTERTLLIRPDKGYSLADARRRADWEARIRAAKSQAVSVTVQGWRQPDGKLWAPNTISHVKARRGLGIDGELLISQVEHSAGEGGRLTQLRLVRPDAFTPEPQKATVSARGVLWDELSRKRVTPKAKP